MDPRFTSIARKLIAEQGRNALIDGVKCKAFLADYAKNEFRKERHLLLIAIEAGTSKEIANASDLEIAKKQQIRFLNEEHFIDPAMAVEVVDFLACLLRDAPAAATVNASSTSARNSPPDRPAPHQAPRQGENSPSTQQTAKSRQGKNSIDLVSLLLAACIIIFVIGYSATRAPQTTTRAKSAGEIFTRAKAAFDNENYQEAITLLDR